MAFVFSCLALAINAHAQFDIRGQISGKVLDSNGAPIRQIQVMAMNLTTLDVKVQMTNNFGSFKFDNVTVGNVYLLQVSSARYFFTFPTQTVNMNSVTKQAFFRADDARFNPLVMLERDF
jgi:hypothetical protein